MTIYGLWKIWRSKDPGGHRQPCAPRTARSPSYLASDSPAGMGGKRCAWNPASDYACIWFYMMLYVFFIWFFMILYDWLVVQCAHLEKYESSMGFGWHPKPPTRWGCLKMGCLSPNSHYLNRDNDDFLQWIQEYPDFKQTLISISYPVWKS